MLHVPNKVTMFLWRACIGAVSTMLDLSSQILDICSFCPMCKFKAESMQHALWTCSCVKSIWKRLDIFMRLHGNMYAPFVYLCFVVLQRFSVGDR